MAVRPLSAVFGGLHPFNIDPLVTGVVFENVKFLGMGLGVALFDDSGSSLEAGLVLEANLTTWRNISYLHLQIHRSGAANLHFAGHIVCMT